MEHQVHGLRSVRGPGREPGSQQRTWIPAEQVVPWVLQKLLFLQYFRGGEGEVMELVEVVGGDERVVNGGQRGLLLRKVRVKVVHIFRRFLEI